MNSDLLNICMAWGLVGARSVGECAVEGVLECSSGPRRIKIALPATFPWAFPEVWLLDLDKPTSRTHVYPSGRICWVDEDWSVPDGTRPDDVIRFALSRTQSLLEMNHETAERDLLRELENHWSQWADEKRVYLRLAPEGAARRLETWNNGKRRILTERSRAQRGALKNSTTNSMERAILLPLSRMPTELLPKPGHPLSPDLVRRALLKAMGPELLRSSIFNGKGFHSEVIILRIDRDGQDPALVGIRFTGHHHKHPLRGGHLRSVQALRVERLDDNWLLLGGRAAHTLRDKRVAVVGCGAVGGCIAHQLARTGIGRLELVDPQILDPPNLYRHILGSWAIGEQKASSLANHLSASLLGLKAYGHDETIQNLLQRNVDFLQELDLLVVAIDRTAHALWLNAYLRRVAPHLPVVHVWLEAHGAAGHALALNGTGRPCLACLYTDPGSGNLREPAVHVLPPGDGTPDPTATCGGRSLQFSFLDSEQTASLATAACLELLEDTGAPSELRSWVRDRTHRRPHQFLLRTFDAAGLHVAGCACCR